MMGFQQSHATCQKKGQVQPHLYAVEQTIEKEADKSLMCIERVTPHDSIPPSYHKYPIREGATGYGYQDAAPQKIGPLLKKNLEKKGGTGKKQKELLGLGQPGLSSLMVARCEGSVQC